MPSIPSGIATVLLTGRYIRPDGTPLVGALTFEPPATLTIADADTISTGAASVTLDESGAFSITLMATDLDTMQPTDWAYTVVERLSHATGRTFHIQLPAATPVVDLADIAPTDPALGDYVLVPGTKFYTGTGTPADTIGLNGDFYFDVTPGAVKLFGPKAAGTWPAGVSLTSGGGSAVTSVAGRTGAVVLAAADVSGVATPANITSAVSAHVSATDPHGDRAAASSALSSHVSATDPHGDRAAAATYTDTKVAAEVTRADAAYVATTDTRMTNSRTPTGSAGGDLGSTYPNPQVTATHLTAPLPVAQGGTGAGSASAALTALGAVASALLGAASGVAQLGTDSKILPAQTQTRQVTKSADTSITSSVTATSDPHLTMSVAVGTYDVECVVVWTNGGGGFKATWAAPAGSTMVWTDNDGVGVSTPTGTVSFTGTTGTTLKGTLVVTTAGTLALQWAQSTSNASATVLKAGCALTLTKTA
ncbi:hypothetical protein ABTY96_03370 [Streptomyces sp. NPDC096057]|uniref:hypothetical protein n=1 Tax=Streptomyces sp. NPDC096057 TaxID=3155543 RepID=UPI00332138CB